MVFSRKSLLDTLMQIFIMLWHLVAEISRFKFDDYHVSRTGPSDLKLFWGGVYIFQNWFTSCIFLKKLHWDGCQKYWVNSCLYDGLMPSLLTNNFIVNIASLRGSKSSNRFKVADGRISAIYERESILTHPEWCMCASVTYRKVSNIRRTLVWNEIADDSDVVGASPVGAAPTTSSFST